jgi:hypothetical protein
MRSLQLCCQMEAYSELLAATAKTLQEYVAENKQLVSGEEVWDWLVKNLPGPAASVTDPKPEDATLVRSCALAVEGRSQPSALQAWSLQANFSTTSRLLTQLPTRFARSSRATATHSSKRWSGWASSEVVDYGEIETRLTFTTYGESQQLKAASLIKAGLLGYRVGCQHALRRCRRVLQHSSVSVRTTSSIDRDVSGSKVDIYARVLIRFKSDYLALGG